MGHDISVYHTEVFLRYLLQQPSNIIITISSLLLCFLLSLDRLPGMEILSVGPNWLVIWLVTWSLTHNRSQSLITAVSLSLVLDGLSSAYPSHLFGLVIVAWFNSSAKSKNDLGSFHSIILVVLKIFFWVLAVEAIIALQYLLLNFDYNNGLWLRYQRIGLSSALLSSVWTPLIYWPLSRWWLYCNKKK